MNFYLFSPFHHKTEVPSADAQQAPDVTAQEARTTPRWVGPVRRKYRVKEENQECVRLGMWLGACPACPRPWVPSPASLKEIGNRVVTGNGY